MDSLALDVAHLFAGGLVLVSFMLLYQDRMTGLVNIFALYALVVSLSVASQSNIQQAPHLYITAAIALIVKAIVIPTVLHRIIVRLGIHRTIEPVVGIGQTMLAGIGLVALSIMVMLPITAQAGTLAREDLAFALSHVVHLCHPEIIVIGGGLSLVGEPLRDSVASSLKRFVMDAFQPEPAVALAGLAQAAGGHRRGQVRRQAAG